MSGVNDGSGLVPSAYADAFARGPPREGVQRVQTRLHKARILTDELADYFTARRELEATYLKSLQKIAKRSFLSDPSALGANFLPVYERLIAEVGEVARIHGDLEKKIEVECELPMRNATTKGEWARIKEHDDNLSGTLKEIAVLEQQLVKDQKKVEGASAKKAGQAQQKVADTERALRQTMELWEAEAPFAFEGYQRIDAQRLELMKEVVAKFETAQSDAAQRTMQMTEQSMQVTLNFDPQTDMQEFTLRDGTSQGALDRPARARPERPETVGAGVATGRGTIAPASALTNAAPVTAQQSNGVNEFGRPLGQQSSASIHSFERQPEQSQQSSSTPSKTIGGSTLKSALTRFGRGKSNRNVNNDAGQQYGALPERASAMPPPSASSGNRTRAPDDSSRQSTEDLANTSAVSGSLMAPLTPKTASGPTPLPITSTPPQVDAEGFSIPPVGRDRKPWETGNAGAASTSLMDDDETTESLDSSLAPRMTGMSITQKPIHEDQASDQAALERMRSTLLTARSPAMQAPQRRNTTRRDRRDVRNTTYNPMLDDGSRPMSTFGLPGIATTGNGTSTSQASPSGFIASPGFGPERSQSMISSDSASNVGNATLDSIATGAPLESGLNAQITERVNVVLQGRNVTKIMVVGEISVSAKDVQALSPVHLRIDAFEQMEKAAPNPQFMKELNGQPGEYTMDLPAIVRQSGSSAATTAGNKGRVTLMKYQLHVPPHRVNEFVPLHVVPQWRCEDQQTSILINYSGNNESRAAKSDSIEALIKEINMSIDVTSPVVTDIMSKPSAIYSAEQKKLLWRLTEPVRLTQEAAIANKALARFKVDEKSEVRPIEVRWKLPGACLSTLDVSLVNAGEMSFSTVSRQLVSGKYTAIP